MRPIDADALIEKCGDWYVEEGTESGFIGTLKDLLATEPTIQPEKAQLSKEVTTKGTTSDLISRTETVERLRGVIDVTVPITDYDGGYVDGVEVGISTVSTMPTIQPEVLACGNGELVAQPEPTDIDAKEAVYNLAEKIGIHQLFALTVELRGEPIQPEPQWIPVSERLPETEEFVLASLTGKYRNITFEHACEIADYADGEWCVYAYPHMSAEKCAELIEAWMPLPTPYKPNK